MRAQDVLNEQMDRGGQPPITEADIVARCDRCGTASALSKCSFAQVEQEGIYRCPSCPETLLTVAAFVESAQPMAGRGYRLGSWVFRNSAELFIRGVNIPASWDTTL